jgi:hypothetical protein
MWLEASVEIFFLWNTPKEVSKMQAQPSITPTAGQPVLQDRKVWETKAKNGANWFFWIAGLSIINTIINIAGGAWAFIIGLGSTQFIDGVTIALIEEYGPGTAPILHLVSFGIDVGIAGIFIVAGLLGRKNYRWAMITGMILYFLDALIFILVGDWLGIAFHALALFGLWAGLRAMNMLRKMTIVQPASISMTPAAPETSLFQSDVFRILGGSCAAYIGLLVVLAVIGFILTS